MNVYSKEQKSSDSIMSGVALLDVNNYIIVSAQIRINC
jgi:hypothetical protein